MTGLEWALAIYMGGVVLAMIAAVLIAARKAAFDRTHPGRDPIERSHDGDIPLFLVVAAVIWPVTPLFAAWWLAWRGLVFLFERHQRRVNDRLTYASRVAARKQREDES